MTTPIPILLRLGLLGVFILLFTAAVNLAQSINVIQGNNAVLNKSQASELPLGPVEIEPLDAPGLAVAEDHQGFMWFGGREGLYRYDGYEFVHYQHEPEDSTSHSANWIECLYVDREGILWIGASAGGLNRFDPGTETFTSYRHDPNDSKSLSSDQINYIFEDEKGQIWVGSQGDLNRLYRESGNFISYQHDATDSTSLSNDLVMVIFEDRHGTLWVGTGSLFLHETPAGEGGTTGAGVVNY